jgi:hypothetical protein
LQHTAPHQLCPFLSTRSALPSVKFFGVIVPPR